MLRKILVSSVVLASLLLPATASAAFNPLGGKYGACKAGGDAQKSSACGGQTTQLTGSHSVIKKASGIVASIAGVTAVIVMMIGALQYVVSNGDAQKTANARSAIIGGAIGLGIIVAAQGILLLVLSKL